MHAVRLAALLCATTFAVGANAADAPKRKSGLWEMTTQMSGMPAGMPAQGPMQMCVDHANDSLTQERGRQAADCPVMEVKQGDNKVTLHSVCKHAGTTATTDAVITGNFDTQYHSEMHVRYNPPQNGIGEMRMTQDARWLGPCKPGQKPGDVVMPGMGNFNPQRQNNDQMLEWMKRQHQAR